MNRALVPLMAAGMVAVMMVTACAGPDEPGGEPEVRPAWTSCAEEAPDLGVKWHDIPAGNDALDLPRLTDGFTPVAVVVCAVQPERRADGGEDLVVAESRADDVAALNTALRLRDQPRTNGACDDMLRLVPWLALVDAQGRWVRPGVPRSACGVVRDEVLRAVEALRLTRVATRSVRQMESAEAVKAGCSQLNADMVWVEASKGNVDQASPVGPLFAGGSAVRACVYKVPADQQRTGKPAGEFSYGGPVPADRWVLIERALRNAGPPARCADPAGQFAVLRADGSGEWVYVELDGCRRILVTPVSGKPLLRQAAPDLIALLAKG